MEKREHLGSRLGFILLSAGCAIGVGNVWKFPWMVGQYGGGAFVVVYLFFLIVLGVPVLTMEFAMGRAAQKSPVRMYQELTPDKKVWHPHGIVAMLGNYILMMFYTTVAGWMVSYFVDSATGAYADLDSAQIADHFGGMLADPVRMTIYMVIVVVFGFAVNSMGLQKGLERVTKVMMLALMVMMVILAANSAITGSKEGLAFYLIPDLDRMMAVGVGEVMVGAMNQAFFTLSLGIGAMAIFGSYLNKDRSLMGEAVNVCVLDTSVALCSGLIIFPACFAYGVEVNSGPSLIFITLPNIFNNMPMGRLWGSLFFVFMSFAALSTVLAVFENILACCTDLFGWSRKKACIINLVLILALSMPCILGYNVWSDIRPIMGKDFLDSEDFIVSNLLLPIGSLIYLLFCTTKRGWGFDKYLEEANTGEGLKLSPRLKPFFQFLLPIMILVILVQGLPNLGWMIGICAGVIALVVLMARGSKS